MLMSKWMIWQVPVFLCAFSCVAQDEIAAKLTPSAINARIDEIRKGDMVIITDPGADVTIEQTRHEFLFGTAICNELAENHENAMSSGDRKKFLEILEENFNYAVHENALKWYDCEKEEGKVDYAVADRIWELCHERGIPMRGHCIFWAKDKFLMPWLKKLDNDALRKAVTRRAIDVTRHYKGRIDEFDLNNEMVHGDFFRRRLGYGIINEMAWIVKSENPDAKLYVNDYGILDVGFNTNAFISQVENLIKNGVPIDGIGCQAHRATALPVITPSERIQKTLDNLAEFNLPVKITECLFVWDDEQVQADELHRLLPIYFAHPAVEAIIMWGFWEGSHWQPQCAMWRKDWSPRPQALAYRDLVFNQWWTNISGRADKKGVFKVRGFYGDYKISSNGKVKTVTFAKGEQPFQVNFK